MASALAAQDPANVHAQTTTVVSKTWIGELEAFKANHPDIDAAARNAHLDEAIRWLRDALDLLAQLRAAGTLEPRYESWFKEIGDARDALEAQRAGVGRAPAEQP